MQLLPLYVLALSLEDLINSQRVNMTCNFLNFLSITAFLQGIAALDLENLRSLGVGDDFYVNDIAVYFNRAFLALPRTVCLNNVTHPTLVEVPWKEVNVILKSRMNKPIEDQVWANCDHLQNAVALAKESSKSKLWVLDKGNEFCSPKLIPYSLLHNTFLTEDTIQLGDQVPQVGLNTFVIEDGIKLGDHRGFAASIGDNKILVCYLTNQTCSQVKISQRNNHLGVINVDFLSISKVSSKLYMTGSRNLGVFYVDLEQPHKASEITVEFCGEKLGLSSGLESDPKEGLIYYLVRDYAVVRWITGTNMTAENHEVLAQSYTEMPFVSRIFSGPQGNIYVLVNPSNPTTCVSEVKIEERAVKVAKYNNWLLEKLL